MDGWNTNWDGLFSGAMLVLGSVNPKASLQVTLFAVPLEEFNLMKKSPPYSISQGVFLTEVLFKELMQFLVTSYFWVRVTVVLLLVLGEFAKKQIPCFLGKLLKITRFKGLKMIRFVFF